MQGKKHPSSYRDPSGFLFYHEGVLYRQVNQSYKEDYDLLKSGLYQKLTEKGLLIPHEEINRNFTGDENWYKTLLPSLIPFISYPYEWCFDMLKEGALLTLDLATEAMASGMMLKDASAYNVQWHEGRLQFIDSLSFERYREDQPWIAYRQFCEHFLAPLAVMNYLKHPLQNLFLSFPEGIPLSLAVKLLPGRSKFNLNHFLHLHLHGKLAAKKRKDPASPPRPFSAGKMKNLLLSLQAAVASLSLGDPTGVWSGYYEEASQRDEYLVKKKELVKEWVRNLQAKKAIDVGANEGSFSELASHEGIYTIAADLDHYSINRLYQRCRKEGLQNIHPVVLDLSLPSPAIGVNNLERSSFLDRAGSDLVLALAVVHHLAIGRNIPFDSIAQMFRKLGSTLVVEYIPKEDEKIKLMLTQKKDVYGWYNRPAFLENFGKHFRIVAEKEIGSSGRSLFLMQAL